MKTFRFLSEAGPERIFEPTTMLLPRRLGGVALIEPQTGSPTKRTAGPSPRRHGIIHTQGRHQAAALGRLADPRGNNPPR